MTEMHDDHDLEASSLLPLGLADLFYLREFFATGAARTRGLEGLLDPAANLAALVDADAEAIASYIRDRLEVGNTRAADISAFLQRQGAGGLYRFLGDPQLRYSHWSQLFPEEWWVYLNFGFHDPRKVTSDAKDPFAPCGALYDELVNGVSLEGRHVLEVGSGRGGGVARVAERFRPARIVGLDAARSHIAFCRQVHPPSLRFLHGRAEALPFSPSSFDVVVCLESCSYYRPFVAFAREVGRCLVPGGFLLLGMYGTPEALEGYVSDALSVGLVLEQKSDLTVGVVSALATFDFRSFVTEHVPSHRQRLVRDGLNILFAGPPNLGTTLRYCAFRFRAA